jgi:hypothetical protein
MIKASDWGENRLRMNPGWQGRPDKSGLIRWRGVFSVADPTNSCSNSRIIADLTNGCSNSRIIADLTNGCSNSRRGGGGPQAMSIWHEKTVGGE